MNLNIFFKDIKEVDEDVHLPIQMIPSKHFLMHWGFAITINKTQG